MLVLEASGSWYPLPKLGIEFQIGQTGSSLLKIKTENVGFDSTILKNEPITSNTGSKSEYPCQL